MATLVGHASWAEQTLIDCGRFYPADCKTPEARLRYYASVFPLVEVDSSYYAIPSQANVQRWVERTPPGFVFNVKAFRFFTGHQTDIQVLPKAVKELLPGRKRILYRDAPEEIREALWQAFIAALEPMRTTGRLGLVHFQFPPSVVPSARVTAHIEACRARLSQDTISIEFRHRSWWDGQARTVETLAWLRSMGAVHTVVDGPQGADNSVPAIWEVTNPNYTLLRLHGRNADAYNAPAASPAERFDYEYSEGELRGLAAELVRLAYRARNTHAIFNNCSEDRGVRNGATFARLLRELTPARPDLSQPFHPNGVLPQLEADVLAGGMKQLPEPGPGQPEERDVEIDTERLGRVRVTYRLLARQHRGKHAGWYWNPAFAQPV